VYPTVDSGLTITLYCVAVTKQYDPLKRNSLTMQHNNIVMQIAAHYTFEQQ